MFDDERPKGRKLKVTVAVVLLLAAIGALAFAGWALVRTKSYTVPDLVGIQEEVALNEISGNDWTVERELERSDEFPEPGTVIRTVPAAGIKLDEGETFVLVVSEGPKLRVLPELNGMPLAEAQAVLTELRLVPVEGTPVYSEDVPAGSVISWTVQDDATLVAGDEVLPDTAIVLVLSQGPAATAGAESRQPDPRGGDGGDRRGPAARRRGRAAVQQRRRSRPRRDPDPCGRHPRRARRHGHRAAVEGPRRRAVP